MAKAGTVKPAWLFFGVSAISILSEYKSFMKNHRYNPHMAIRLACFLLCLGAAITIGFYYHEVQDTVKTELAGVSLHSIDDSIIIKWNAPGWNICDYVTIQVADESGIIYERNLWPVIEKLSYKNGEHGKAYTVSVAAHYRDGSFGEKIEKRALFLDYDRLPRIPLMVIQTYSGDDPDYNEAKRPDDSLWGATITDNEYLAGEMAMSGGGLKSVSGSVKIRVRGNTSSVDQEKKSYKIKLQDPCDLLDRKKGCSCKEWVLLNNGRNLNTYIGNYIGTLCGMEWQPQMAFVNVILNGDWKGCYCLTEAVCLESSYGLVGDTGYIFENDTYWWNSDGDYFKTDNQIYELGYTFKYPEIRDKGEGAVLALQRYMQEFEDRILGGDLSYQDYIDEKSYSNWILARDILGNFDGGGSNMYFYKYDFDENNATSSKVKMGPLWDFDGIFMTEGQWSDSRSGRLSYFPQLFGQDTFLNAYTESWKNIFPDLCDNVKIFLEDFEEDYGEDMDASWRLDSSRWNVSIAPFYKQKENALDWFFDRTVWMNNSLHIPAAEFTVTDISGYEHVKDGITWFLDESHNVDGGIYRAGWAFIKDLADNPGYGSVGIMEGQKAYLANECGRGDVQKAYGLPSDQIGFYIYTGFEGGTLCIIDEENKIIYEAE